MQWSSCRAHSQPQLFCEFGSGQCCVYTVCVCVLVCVSERKRARRRKGRIRLPIPVTQIIFHFSACDSTFPSLFMLVASSLPALSLSSPSSSSSAFPLKCKCKLKFALFTWQWSLCNPTDIKIIILEFLLFLYLLHHHFSSPLLFSLPPPFCFPSTSSLCAGVCIGIISSITMMDDTKRLRPSGVELCLSTQSLPVPHTHKPFSHVHLQTWTFLDVYQDVTEKRVRMQTPDAFGSDISRLLACQLYWYKACVISDYAQFHQYENSCEITRWVSCVLLPLFSSTCYPGSTII